MRKLTQKEQVELGFSMIWWTIVVAWIALIGLAVFACFRAATS